MKFMNKMFSQRLAYRDNILTVDTPGFAAQMHMLPPMYCGNKRYAGKERGNVAHPACRPRVPMHNVNILFSN